MAEPIAAPAAPAAAAAASPAPAASQAAAPVAPAAPSGGGMKDFISKMGKTAPAEPPGAPSAPVAPAVTTGVAAAAEDHPDVPDAVWDKAPKNLKNAYYKTKREMEGKLTATEAKLKELESKPNQSPADLKKIQELEARSTKLEKDLEEREQRLLQADFSQSGKFQKEYVKRGQDAYSNAVAEIKSFVVKYTDKNGEEQQRPGTEGDLNMLRNLPPYERSLKLSEMFGPAANDIRDHIKEIQRIEKEANEAIAGAKATAEEERRTWQKQSEERNTEYKSHIARVNEEMVKTHAAYFAPDPTNPEASSALERGLKYVDDAAANVSKMSPKDQAETHSMIRYLAGAAPRLMTENNQLKTKLTALEDELGKYRKSSPGSAPAPAGGGAKAPVEEKRGVDAMKEMMLASGKR